MAVERAVTAVKAVLEQGCVERLGATFHLDLVELADVVQISARSEHDFALGPPPRRATSLLASFANSASTGWPPRDGAAFQRAGEGAHVVVLDVGDDHSGGAEHGGLPRHEYDRDLELGGDRAGVQRSGAAGDDERVFTRVLPALDRDVPTAFAIVVLISV